MKRKTVLAAAEHHERQLQEQGFKPVRAARNYDGRSKKIWGNHALFMVRRIRLMLFTSIGTRPCVGSLACKAL